MMGTNKKVEIDLSTKVVDYDNIFATMATQVELLTNKIRQKFHSQETNWSSNRRLKDSNFKLKLTVVSNGVREKEIECSFHQK